MQILSKHFEQTNSININNKIRQTIPKGQKNIFLYHSET